MRKKTASRRARALVAVLAIMTVITMMPAGFAADEACAATAAVREVHLQEWYNALEAARDYYNGGNASGKVFTYNKSGTESKGYTNCAGYVSRAMRSIGWLPSSRQVPDHHSERIQGHAPRKTARKRGAETRRHLRVPVG